MSTCNQLDLQTLGSQPIMSKNHPDHWSRASALGYMRAILEYIP